MKDIRLVMFMIAIILVSMTLIFKSIGKEQNKINISKLTLEDKYFVTKEKCIDGIMYVYYADTKNKRSGLTTKFNKDGIETCGE